MSCFVNVGAYVIVDYWAFDWFTRSFKRVFYHDDPIYTGNLRILAYVQDKPIHILVKIGSADRSFFECLLADQNPFSVFTFAGETLVNYSIHGSSNLVQVNIYCIFILLDSIRGYSKGLTDEVKVAFRFIYVSTEKLYYFCSKDYPSFDATNYYDYDPNSSKNYVLYRFAEKHFQLMIFNLFTGNALPVYGDSIQKCDCFHVKVHYFPIRPVFEAFQLGDYCILVGWIEMMNVDIAHIVCILKDELRLRANSTSYTTQFNNVIYRLSHDKRYSIGVHKLERESGWKRAESFETVIRKKVQCYLDDAEWVTTVQCGTYRELVGKKYEGSAA
jgi:dTDP-glucose 4,6-dehydratase